MSKEFIVPKTSPEIAIRVYSEVLGDQSAFIRKEAQILERENSSYLAHLLYPSAHLSALGDKSSVQQILTGILFRYECTRRELEKSGFKIPLIGNLTYERTSQELKRLFAPSPLIIVSLQQEDPLDRLTRLRITQTREDDPQIGEIMQALTRKPRLDQEINDTFSFIEGIHTGHLHLKLMQNEKSIDEPNPESPSTSIVPKVRGEISRSVLLETILEPHAFVDQTLRNLLDYSPSMVSRIESNFDNLTEKGYNSFQLLAAITVACIMGEFKQREQKFPIIGDSQIRHTDPEIEQAITEDQDSLITGMLIHKFNLSTIAEIKSTNPDLYQACKPYIDAFRTLAKSDDGKKLAGAVNGLTLSYTTIKSGLQSGRSK